MSSYILLTSWTIFNDFTVEMSLKYIYQLVYA